jgi:hypothetical protein
VLFVLVAAAGAAYGGWVALATHPQSWGIANDADHDVPHGMAAALDDKPASVAGRVVNQSLCCRETEFCPQRQRRRNGSGRPRRPLQRQDARKQPRQFGASRPAGVSASVPPGSSARIAAIRELLDRGFGKPTQFVAADNEPALEDLNLEELRAEILADFERSFPEYRVVRAKQLKVIS